MTTPKKRCTMTLSQFFRHVYCKRKSLTESTKITYRASVNAFQDWVSGKPVPLGSITAEVLRKFLAAYGEDNSPASASQKRNTLLFLLKYARRWGFVDSPPIADDIPVTKIPKCIPQAWTVEEFGQIISACHVAKTIHNRRKRITWTGRHWRALLLTIYDTGERLTALVATRRRENRAARCGVFYSAAKMSEATAGFRPRRPAEGSARRERNGDVGD